MGKRVRQDDPLPLRNPELEALTLGAMLIDRAAIDDACGIVSADDFADSNHQIIFATIVQLHLSGSIVDPALLAQALMEANVLEQVGGIPAIAALIDATVTPANVQYHAGKVRELAARRRIAEAARQLAENPTAEGFARLQQLHDHQLPRVRPFTLLTDSEIEQLPKPEWLIDSMLARPALAVLYGQPGSGKSFLAIAMALSIATGEPFLRHTVQRGNVVYIAPEGAHGIGARVAAWKAHHGFTGSAGVFFLPACVSLLDAHQVASTIAMVRSLEPAAVIVDTLARSIPGGDENSAQDMGMVIRHADQMKEALQATVVLVHHTNAAGERERGSTALRGAADTMIAVSSEDGVITVRCEKQKDAPPFERFELVLTRVLDSAVIGADLGPHLPAEAMRPMYHKLLALVRSDFLEEGPTASEWRDAAEGVGIKKRRFFEGRTWLYNMGYVTRTHSGRGARYTLTDIGREALGAEVRLSAVEGARTNGTKVRAVAPPP